MTTQCAPDLLPLPRDLRDDSLRRLSDDDLLRRTGELTGRSRRAEADLLAHLGEIDARRLYLREACASMFAYCTERLRFSEGEAFLRIAAARSAREHPVILAMLADGRLHLSAVVRLAPHLTSVNRDAVLGRAVHRSKREVLELVAGLSPRPDAPALIRRLPARVDSPPAAASPRPATAVPAVRGLCPDNVDRLESTVWPPPAARRPEPPWQPPVQLTPPTAATFEPLAPARFKVQFTASAKLRDKLERLRALMRSTIPDADLATVIEEAVTEKLARLERVRSAATGRPRKSLAETKVETSSRHVPAAVRRAVNARDRGRCAYRDAEGRRCSAREQLEYHHRHPYGHGGDHSVGNVALLCRAHNRFLEEIDYGARGGSS